MRVAAWALALGACGIPAGRFEALEASFDAAAAARDRARAELDACRAGAEAQSSAAQEAGRPAEAARAAWSQLPGAEGTRWTTAPSDWFVAGTADRRDPPPAALERVATALASAPGRVVVEVAVGEEVADPREYPSRWFLASDRAVALAEGLVAAGLPADRVVAAAAAGPPRVTVRWEP